MKKQRQKTKPCTERMWFGKRRFCKASGVRGIKQKRFGQHFLSDPFVLDMIVKTIDPQQDETIIEVGCGKGVLTEQLVRSGAHVTGVELDNDMIPILKQKFGLGDNFDLLRADILDFVPRTKEAYKLVGNIPYNLTTKLFERILLWEHKPSFIVFLIQKEVGEKIVKHGWKNSSLAVLVDMIGEARIVATVSPHAFDPPPKVDSIILSIDHIKAKTLRVRSPKPLGSTQELWQFYDFVHKIFRHPRKTLLNNLLTLVSKEKAMQLCQHNNLVPSIRPEKLSFEVLEALYGEIYLP